MPPTCPESSYIATPDFLLFALHGATAISIPAHGFGLFCILFKTPDQMKTVKWYFVNLHFWIICYDYSVCLLTVPMLIFPTMSGYTLGISSDFGVSNIVQTVLVLVLLEYVLISILAIFENRFHTVCTYNWKHCWSLIRPFWLLTHYIIGILILIPFGFLTPNQEIAKKLVLESLPCIPDYLLQADLFVLSDDYTYHMIVMVTFLVTGILEGCVFIILLVINTIDQLHSQRISQNLFLIQKKFFIALVLQMLVPLVLLLIPLAYSCFSIFYNYYNQAFSNVAVTMESTHGVVSSLVMIFIHRPYREAFFNLFSRKAYRERKSSHLMNQSGTHNNQIGSLRYSLNKV